MGQVRLYRKIMTFSAVEHTQQVWNYSLHVSEVALGREKHQGPSPLLYSMLRPCALYFFRTRLYSCMYMYWLTTVT